MTNPAPPVDDARVTDEMVEAALSAYFADMIPRTISPIAGLKAQNKDNMRKAIQAALLSRIPSEEATEEEVRAAFRGYGRYTVADVQIAKILARAGLAITRAPGAKT